jgi:hypothetical protein
LISNAGTVAIDDFGTGKFEAIDDYIAIGNQDTLPFGIRSVAVI